MNFTKNEQARRRSMLNQARTGNNQRLTAATLDRWEQRKRRDEAWARSIGVYLTYGAVR